MREHLKTMICNTVAIVFHDLSDRRSLFTDLDTQNQLRVFRWSYISDRWMNLNLDKKRWHWNVLWCKRTHQCRGWVVFFSFWLHWKSLLESTGPTRLDLRSALWTVQPVLRRSVETYGRATSLSPWVTRHHTSRRPPIPQSSIRLPESTWQNSKSLLGLTSHVVVKSRGVACYDSAQSDRHGPTWE